jgi:hypothetical protein
MHMGCPLWPPQPNEG